MQFPKIEVAWNLVFNDTGLDSMKWLQSRFIFLVEKIGVLHCVPQDLRNVSEFTDKLEEVINGVPCRLYVRFNKEERHIDCFAFKAMPLPELNNEEHDES